MNVLDVLRDKVGYGLSKHLSEFLGEDESATSSGVNASFSTLLAGMIDKGSTDKGASDLFKTIENQDTDILNHIDRIFTRSPQTVNGLSNVGTRDLPKFLGNHTREAGNLIAETSSLKRNATSKLMKISTPFLMALLGKKIKEDKLDAKGLMSLINGQKAQVESSLPNGMIDELELKSFGWTKKEVVEVVEEKKPKKQKKEKVIVPKEDVVDVDASRAATTSASSGTGFLRWLLPLLALAGILFYIIFRTGCAATAEKAASTVATKTTNVVEKTAEVAKSALGSVNDVALKSLEGINFGVGSAGSQMMDFIKGGATGEGRFRFTNLNFASGSALISGESGVEVDHMSSILKAYPDVKVIIEGYTDSQGNPESNITLSQQRADAVMNRLIAEGIDGARITTKGFGAANPIGDNATSEGRAQNRRIEVVIAK